MIAIPNVVLTHLVMNDEDEDLFQSEDENNDEHEDENDEKNEDENNGAVRRRMKAE